MSKRAAPKQEIDTENITFSFADPAPGEIGSYLGGGVAIASIDGFRGPPGFGKAVLRMCAQQPNVRPEEIVAYTLFSNEPRDKAVVISVHTTPAVRRRGIATRLYNALERHYGVTLRPSGAQTDEGRALWKHRT